jgi:guanine nucleotide-binding protein subunit beta-2-like 1 protein
MRYSPDQANPTMVSASYGKHVYVWDMERLRLEENHIEHTTSVNTVSISPDGSLCASGRKDGAVMLCGLSIKSLYTHDAGSVANARIFSPTCYWLCDATDKITRF